jgi:RpiB/LacA/LacB family sugar-phosphate isomerase
MRVAIAYNDSGCKLAESIISLLRQRGHHILEFNNSNPDDTDYTDLTYCAGQEVLAHHADRAILICGSGLCTCIAANKMKGLYASPCYDVFEAHVSRSKYNTNVLCLSDRWIDNRTAVNIVKEWLETPFQGRPIDIRSLNKIEEIEDKQLYPFSSCLNKEIH